MDPIVLTGTIYQIGETVAKTEKFSARNFVLLVDDFKYPQHFQLQLMNDKCSMIDSYNVGDKISVSINLVGKKYTKNDGTEGFFNSMNAWQIQGSGEKPNKPVSSTPSPTPPPVGNPPASDAFNFDDDTQNLPF